MAVIHDEGYWQYGLDVLAHDKDNIYVSRSLIKTVGLDGAIIYEELVSIACQKLKAGLIDDGWLGLSVEYMRDSYGLSKHQQSTILRKLQNQNLIEVEYHGIPRSRCIRVGSIGVKTEGTKATMPYWKNTTYLLFNEEDGVYLRTPWGDIAPREDVEEIVPLLLKTAREHEKDIIIHNLKNDGYATSARHETGGGESARSARLKSVYMLRCGDRYKIGISENVPQRLKALDNRPYPVELVAVSKPFSGAYEVEQRLLAMHADGKTDGEWFISSEQRAKQTAILVENASDAHDEGD